MDQKILKQNVNHLQSQIFSKRRMIEKIRNVSFWLNGREFPMSKKLPQALNKSCRPRQRRANFSSGYAIGYQHSVSTQPMHQFWVPPQPVMPFYLPAQQQFVPPLASYECNEHFLSSQNVPPRQNQVWPSPSMAYPSSVHQHNHNTRGTTKDKRTKRSQQFAKNFPLKFSRNYRNKNSNMKKMINSNDNKTNENEMQSKLPEMKTAESSESNHRISSDVEKRISDAEYSGHFFDAKKLMNIIRESCARETSDEEDQKALAFFIRLLFAKECPTLDSTIRDYSKARKNQQEDVSKTLEELVALKMALPQLQKAIEEKLEKLITKKMNFHEIVEKKLNELLIFKTEQLTFID